MVECTARLAMAAGIFALFMAASESEIIKNEAICAPNEEGGYVVLTKYPTGEHGELMAIYTKMDGNSDYGYWTLDGANRIIVVYDSGSYEFYDLDKFGRCAI